MESFQAKGMIWAIWCQFGWSLDPTNGGKGQSILHRLPFPQVICCNIQWEDDRSQKRKFAATAHSQLCGVDSGTVLRKVELDSTFTHDAARFGDKVFICDTGRGTILELSYPSMEKVKFLIISRCCYNDAGIGIGLGVWIFEFWPSLSQSQQLIDYCRPKAIVHNTVVLCTFSLKQQLNACTWARSGATDCSLYMTTSTP